MNDNYLAFISYARFDDEHNNWIISNSKKRLEDEIKSQSGQPYPVFQDTSNIPLGDDWNTTIKKALDTSKVFIAFLSPSFFASSACKKELEYYFTLLEQGQEYRKIIPIYLTECKYISQNSDKFFEKIFKIQYEDWRYLRNISSDSTGFKEIIFNLVCKILDLTILASKTNKQQSPPDTIKYNIEDAHLMDHDMTKKEFPKEAIMDFSRLIPNYYSISNVIYGDFSAGDYEDAVIFSKLKDHTTNITIVIYNENEHKPIPVYSSQFEDSLVDAFFGAISRYNQKVLVISDSSGSGRYLHYVVLGYVDAVLKKLLERDLIFDGSIVISDGRLLEMMGSQGVLFEWDGHAMLATELPMQPIFPRNIFDKLVEYSILDDGTVHIECETTIHMQTSQCIQLNRINRGIVERILYNGDGILEFINGSVVAVREGTTSIQIVPGGYDWQKALTLTIIVE